MGLAIQEGPILLDPYSPGGRPLHCLHRHRLGCLRLHRLEEAADTGCSQLLYEEDPIASYSHPKEAIHDDPLEAIGMVHSQIYQRT